MPDAYTPTNFPSGVYSRIFARCSSAECVSGSSTFDPDPTATNMRFPSCENTTSLVQWPPPGGRLGTMTSAAPLAFKSPLRYGSRTTESVLPTYTHSGLEPGG